MEDKHSQEVIAASITYRKELLSLYSEKIPNFTKIEEKRKEQSKRYDSLLANQEREMHEMLYSCIKRRLE